MTNKMTDKSTSRGDDLNEALETLVQYAKWQMEEGTDYHPTLPSAIAKAEQALQQQAGGEVDVLSVIKRDDEGYDLATIGMEFQLDGDKPLEFLQAVQERYFTQKPEPVAMDLGKAKTDAVNMFFDGMMFARQSGQTAMKERVEQIVDHLANSGVIGGWQPIETAPKMRNILLFAMVDIDNGKMDTGFWHKGYEGDPEYSPWCWEGRQIKKYEIQPTHWMPLPTPPATDKE